MPSPILNAHAPHPPPLPASLQDCTLDAPTGARLAPGFPGLTDLTLMHCTLDTAALLTRLQACPQLARLAVLGWTRSPDKDTTDCTLLLAQLPSLTSLELDGGCGSGLLIHRQRHQGPAPPPSNNPFAGICLPGFYTEPERVSVIPQPRLRKLVWHGGMGFGSGFRGQHDVALVCPALTGLTSLSIPDVLVEQEALDAMLRGCAGVMLGLSHPASSKSIPYLRALCLSATCPCFSCQACHHADTLSFKA